LEQLGVLVVRLAKQNCAISEVVPLPWNGLSLALRLFRRVSSDSFYAHLKAVLFSGAGIRSTRV